MTLTTSLLDLTLLLLLASVIGVVVFRFVQLPPMLGYLAVGAVVGPHALGWIPDLEQARTLAEFGVVFLMFSIGLEFDLSKLRAMRSTVFGVGSAQVVATIVLAMAGTLAASALFGHAVQGVFEIGWTGAFALGAVLAMSSTAIVIKMLAEKSALDTPHGRQIFGVLLFQDLAVVPLLILIPTLARGSDPWIALGLAAAKATFVLTLLLVVGQRLMRAWFHVVARRRSRELFMLNLLLITLGLAWITDYAGLSLALGAFVAGVLIAETEYRHQVEQDIKPFQDVLLGLFFITIGMLLDPKLIAQHWVLVAFLLIVPVLLKCAVIACVVRAFGASPGTAIRTGLALCTAGEFGFVLLNHAGTLDLMSPVFMQCVLAGMLLSMFAAPFLIEHMDRIALRFVRSEWMTASLDLTRIAARSMTTERHMIICGYGRSGQNIARLLERESIGYVALDLDPDRVRDAAAAGESVVFGDAARRESLIAAGLLRAQALVITYADTASALKVLAHTRTLAPQVPVIVRTPDDADLERLRAAGAAEVVPEVLEGSLMLGAQALVQVGVPVNTVLRLVQDEREARYVNLRGYFRGIDDADDARAHIHLHSVPLPPGAAAVGQRLGDLGLDLLGVEVTSVRSTGPQPVAVRSHAALPELVLQAGDIVVVRGMPEAVARAEERLLAK